MNAVNAAEATARAGWETLRTTEALVLLDAVTAYGDVVRDTSNASCSGPKNESRRSRNVPIEVRAEMTGGLLPRWLKWFRSRVTSHSSAPTHSATLAWPYGSERRPQYGQAV